MRKELILEALASIQDPLTGQKFQPEHRVRDLKVEGNEVSFRLVVPNLNESARFAVISKCEDAIKFVNPNANVHIQLDMSQPKGNLDWALPQVKNIIAVASGKGGVGKSTVSVNLALSLKNQGLRVGIIDADVYGPSIPTLLKLQGQRPKVKEVYKKPKLVPLEAYGMPCISMGSIIEPEQAVVLRGPRLAGIIKQFFNEVVWPELDVIVVDLPPGTGDVQLTLVQTVPVTGAVLVTTPQEVAYVDAIKAMNMFMLPNVNVPILGVVENMSWFTPPDLPERKYYLFGEGAGKKLAKEANAVLLGQIPLVQDIGTASDTGVPPATAANHVAHGYYDTIAKTTLRELARRTENLPPTKPVEVK